MPGFRTYSRLSQPQSLTTYTLAPGSGEDRREGPPGKSRDWRSGNYADASFYKVRYWHDLFIRTRTGSIQRLQRDEDQ